MADHPVYKLSHTTRIRCTAVLAGVPQPLAGKTVIVVHQFGTQKVTLTQGAGVDAVGGPPGLFVYDVTQANLTTLGAGEGDLVQTTINIWNADNTLLLHGSAMIEVDY
jgi:hypothetical protein